MANAFSRWVPASFPFFDTTVKVKLRAFDKREAPAFKARVTERFAGVERLDGESEADHAARADAALERWKAFTRETFVKYVRVAEPLMNEEDGESVIDGQSLYDIGTGDFHLAVMVKLGELASLGDTEGKGSASPSTSTVDQASQSSASPVTSTANEVGPTPSTVTAAPIMDASSSVVV
jgi:hypothetical protein